MVVTPHCGAYSLSLDLRSDEISATGGHRFFAQIKDLDSCSTIHIYSIARTLRLGDLVQNNIIPVFLMFSQLELMANDETNKLSCFVLTSSAEGRVARNAERDEHFIIMNYEL